MRFTDKAIRAVELPEGQTVRKIAIEPGLFVRVARRPDGKITRSYYLRYSINRGTLAGKTYTDAIGSCESVTLDEARDIATEWRGYVARGYRPREYVKSALASAKTFAEVYVSWQGAKEVGLSDNTLTLHKAHRKFLAPLDALTVNELKREDGAQIVLSLVKAGKYSTASIVAARLAAVMQHAVNTGLIESNPFVKLSSLVTVPQSKHFLSVDPESPAEGIENVLAQCLPLSLNIRKFIALGFFTMLRPAEVAELRVENIQADRIVCKRTKTLPEGCRVPMTPELEKLCNVLTNGRTQGKIAQVCTEWARRNLKELGIEFHLHGWRAAGAAWMVKHGTPLHITEACLTHKIGGQVTVAYIRGDFFEERKAAMEPYHQFLWSVLQKLAFLEG